MMTISYLEIRKCRHRQYFFKARQPGVARLGEPRSLWVEFLNLPLPLAAFIFQETRGSRHRHLR